jgi:hypothetical protein
MLQVGPVTMAWRVLGLRMDEPPQTCKVAANILNKQSQSRTAGKGFSSSLGIGRGANNSSL